MNRLGKVGKSALIQIYTRLFKAFGPQKWWPAQTRFEVIVGAILTQNTNWGNVEKALRNLKSQKLLSPQAFRNISQRKLAVLIKPSGYFNVKAKRLKSFISFLFNEYDGNLRKMGKENTSILRQKLLAVNGVGPETADSILLYAFNKPIFVVDAYTRRIFYRHNIVDRDEDYVSIQKKFMKSLRHEPQMFNEYHALIVRLGKDFCKPKPLCEQCLLNNFHYSLIEKCVMCHRALPRKNDRKIFQNHFICLKCFKK